MICPASPDTRCTQGYSLDSLSLDDCYIKSWYTLFLGYNLDSFSLDDWSSESWYPLHSGYSVFFAWFSLHTVHWLTNKLFFVKKRIRLIWTMHSASSQNERSIKSRKDNMTLLNRHGCILIYYVEDIHRSTKGIGQMRFLGPPISRTGKLKLVTRREEWIRASRGSEPYHRRVFDDPKKTEAKELI
jgi:hypothetical protein